MAQHPGRLSGATFAVALLLAAPAVHAQVGDVSGVDYPGWMPSDRVAPVISTTVEYEESDQRWRYVYTVGNGIDAEQDILSFWLRFTGVETNLSAPPGWYGLAANLNGFYPEVQTIPGARFAAELPNSIGDSPNGPADAQIPPGEELSGFELTSPFGPGYARTYVRGFAPVPYLPDGYDEPTTTHHDTTDAQRGWGIAPTRYTEVLSLGTSDVVNADGFLGFMNLTAVGTALRDPAPIAIKFSVRGETVLRETFVATLNGIDVTAAFRPAGPDGADLVALFSVASSPLVPGENLLITTVTGNLPGTSPAVTAVDTDRMTFVVTQ